MSEFEYFVGAISIVLGLTVARCLDALPSAFASRRRYGAHLAWVLIKLANPVVILWSFWSIREVHDLTFVSLVAAFTLSATLYLQVIALVTTNPDAVDDWAAHYFAKRRLFFGVNALFLAQLGALNLVSAGVNAILGVQLVMIGLSVAAMASDRPRLHAWVAGLASLNMFGALFGMLAG